jgi:ketosteroid isomerase-like protein
VSHEHVEIVRRVLASFNSGGDEKLTDELVESEATFEPLLLGVEGEPYRGADGIMRWISEMHETLADVHADFSEIEDRGDLMLLTGQTTGRGRETGAPFEQRWVIAARFRSDRLSYVKICRTREEALEAAGLP